MIRGIINHIFAKLIKINVEKENIRKQKSLTNSDFTLLTRNCMGGVILHDLNQRFDTPIVNGGMTTKNFLLFLKHLEDYCEADLVENFEPVTDDFEKIHFPIGTLIPSDGLRPIDVYFVHYKTFEEAKELWYKRVKRMHLDNLYIILEEDTRLKHEDLLEFDKLDYKNKVALTDKMYLDISCAHYMRNLRNSYPGKLLEHKYLGISGKRYLDEFDYVAFFNQK